MTKSGVIVAYVAVLVQQTTLVLPGLKLSGGEEARHHADGVTKTLVSTFGKCMLCCRGQDN